MPTDLILAFASYAFVTSITPGPNNGMLLASGANFGFARTIPHIAGINLGFGAMVLAVGLGAGSLFTQWPALFLVVKLIGASYLAYLAWRIATASAPDGDANLGSPMTFIAAAAFQWVNPKAWIMVIGALSTYLPVTGGTGAVVALATIYVLVNLPCIIVWAASGVAVRRILTTPTHLAIFNRVMAGLLLISLLPIVNDIASIVRQSM
ncbi:MAG: LysE family translocator [Hyphomicrobiaceae bacterium]